MAELHYKDGGTWRKAKELHYRDGGTWRKLKEAWYRDGGTWRKVFSGLAIVLTNRTVYAWDNELSSPTASAIAGITVASSGALTITLRGSETGDSDTDLTTEWLTGGTASDYECRFSPSSGSLSNGPAGWNSCSTSRTFDVRRTRTFSGSSTKTCTGTLEIRRAADAVVLATATITLIARADFEA